MNRFQHDAAVLQHLQRMVNCLFAPHFKNVEGHGFPLHFMDNPDVAGVFRLGNRQKAFAVYGQFAVLIGGTGFVFDCKGYFRAESFAVGFRGFDAVLYINLCIIFHFAIPHQYVPGFCL